MFAVLGFYKFKKIALLNKKKIYFQKLFIENNINGTLILSKEGINGSISGKSLNISYINKKIRSYLKFSKFDSVNLSKCIFQPFHKPKIKIKKEVVPMGLKITPRVKKNNHLSPSKWNKLIQNKNTLVLDARKSFEYEVGTFKRSINPQVNHFRKFPKYLNKLDKKKPIAMFCTGGIRCEKASAYLSLKGFKNVFQLKGGILNYLKKISKTNSLWKGECFVFDNRVSLKHELRLGTYSMCSGCRMPISPKDKRSNKYEEGVSCPNCHDKLTETQKSRFRMRQSQVYKAKQSRKKYIFQKEFK